MLEDPEKLLRWPMRIVEAWDETARHRLLRVDATGHPCMEDGGGRYRLPGQFVAMGAAGVPARYFAIASTPEELPVMDFLVSRGTETTDALASLEAGDGVEVSAVFGEGYRVMAQEPPRLVVLATGSGIAAVRPVVRSLWRREPGLRARTRLFYGEGAPCEHAWRDELRGWREDGAEVHLLCDAPGEGSASRRYVQESWWDSTNEAECREAAFVVCGATAMQDAAVVRLREAGVPDDRIHFNH